MGGMGGMGGPRKDPPISSKLPTSLEELYKGSTRKLKISRTVTDASGKQMRVSEVLPVSIKPGWKSGTKVTFSEKGNFLMSLYSWCPQGRLLQRPTGGCWRAARFGA